MELEEHLDSRSSLEPGLPVADGRLELCALVEAVVSAELKVAGFHRELSDAERELASCLEKLRLYWIRERVESLEDEPGAGAPVIDKILTEVANENS